MDQLLREGVPSYVIHIRPETKGGKEAEHFRATAEPTATDESKRNQEEEEELKKHIPPKYHDFLDVFSPGEVKELPPHRPYNI